MTQTATREERPTDTAEEPTSTALAQREEHAMLTSPAIAMSDAELNRSYRIARALASSGMFKDVRQGEQAFAKILIGRDLGLSPTEAMTNIHLIEGKPELSANLHAAKVKQTPGYDYKVVELSNEKAVVEFYRDDELLGTSEFTIEDAATAKLEDKPGPNAGPGNYKRYPRNMLFSRAMTNGVAWFCPEVMGSLRVYAMGEVEEMEGVQSQAEVTNEYDWASIENEDLRERVRGAVETANELEPGSWLPAKCEMTFTGRPEKALLDIVAGIEAHNAELIQARVDAEPVDAEVVPEEEGGEPAPAEAQEGAQEEAEDAPDPEVALKVDGLRRRLMDLEAHLERAEEGSREHDELSAEAEKVRAELKELGGEDPGQSSLEIP